ncbi:MAG: membrane protein insertion efficiency factor YidD [Puniceicoccales bacterium]|jgi:putative membrane protein insertion efficiency factor|nr:membrane protein insertion efficiency factor YidD [Puniceicoccales bacterium]
MASPSKAHLAASSTFREQQGDVQAHLHPATRVTLWLLRFYQRRISPPFHFLFGPWCGCRFAPTCSEYARQAITRHGFSRGAWMAVKRLCRCHPLHPGGVDEVPQ